MPKQCKSNMILCTQKFHYLKKSVLQTNKTTEINKINNTNKFLKNILNMYKEKDKYLCYKSNLINKIKTITCEQFPLSNSNEVSFDDQQHCSMFNQNA